jgi:hypothetical protein
MFRWDSGSTSVLLFNTYALVVIRHNGNIAAIQYMQQDICSLRLSSWIKQL